MFFLLLFHCNYFVYILDTSLLYQILQIVSPVCDCYFPFLSSDFESREDSHCGVVQFSIIAFMFHVSGDQRKFCLIKGHRDFFLYFLLMYFRVLDNMITSIIHFELIFLYKV